MQYICLHKEIALQNALRYNFALLNPASLFEFRGGGLPS